MRSAWRTAAALALLPGVLAAQGQPCSPAHLVASSDESQLYIADATRHAVLLFDTAGLRVSNRIVLPAPPSGMALAPDGKLLAITVAAPRGRVLLLDTTQGALAGSLAAGHMPTAPLFDPGGETLYLCNRFANSVAILDLETGRTRARVAVPREPVCAALDSTGARLFVGNHLPVGAADGDYSACEITVIDTAAAKVCAHIALPNGATSLREVCLSPDGRFLFATHVLARYHAPTTQLERGWMNTNALSIIDATGLALINTVLLDDVDLGAANPWGLACTPDGATLVVSHAGSHELSLIDLRALLAKLAGLAESEAAEVCNDLSFLVGLRRRIPLAGNGPRGLALTAGRVWAAEYFSGSLAAVALDAAAGAPASSIPLAPPSEPSPARRGEQLFNDASLCFQHWQSCASCHPDGRADALNWDLLNDGFGNPKNTKSLLLAPATPPAMISGARASAAVAVRSGIRHILFATRPESEARAIDAYLAAMRPVPSPHLAGSALSAAARRGRALFEQAQCSRCHPAPLYTDKKSYDLGTGRGRERDRAFDTPTLVEIWRTAPYLHDGRAPDLRAMLRACDENKSHGRTSQFTPQQLDDLIAFVLSL